MSVAKIPLKLNNGFMPLIALVSVIKVLELCISALQLFVRSAAHSGVVGLVETRTPALKLMQGHGNGSEVI
jgi:hypothetical protein